MPLAKTPRRRDAQGATPLPAWRSWAALPFESLRAVSKVERRLCVKPFFWRPLFLRNLMPAPFLLPRWRMESGGNLFSDPPAEFVCRVEREPCCRNRRVYDHFRMPAPDMVSVRLQDVPRAVQRDWNNWHGRLNRQIKGSTPERQKLPIAAAVPLGKKHHGRSRANSLAGEVQALQGLPRSFTLDGDVARAAQVPAEEWEVK